VSEHLGACVAARLVVRTSNPRASCVGGACRHAVTCVNAAHELYAALVRQLRGHILRSGQAMDDARSSQLHGVVQSFALWSRQSADSVDVTVAITMCMCAVAAAAVDVFSEVVGGDGCAGPHVGGGAAVASSLAEVAGNVASTAVSCVRHARPSQLHLRDVYVALFSACYVATSADDTLTTLMEALGAVAVARWLESPASAAAVVDAADRPAFSVPIVLSPEEAEVWGSLAALHVSDAVTLVSLH
jgi:hypothetical protein